MWCGSPVSVCACQVQKVFYRRTEFIKIPLIHAVICMIDGRILPSCVYAEGVCLRVCNDQKAGIPVPDGGFSYRVI